MLRTTLAFVLLLVAGCAGGAATPHEHVHESAAPSTSASASTGFTDTDNAYVQLAIPQDETALKVVELARARAGVAPDLVALAGDVEAGHRAELDGLRAALAKAGKAYESLHEGHDMPGMVTAAELDAVAKATGGAFDDQLRTLLRAHFEESTTVAKSEQSAGSDRAVIELAKGIERVRADYLARLGTS
jgi:uncharacterized protein (DUF305 family)